MRTSRFAFALLLSLLGAACTHGARLDTPKGFADLGGADGFSYRAASAKGVVIATRTQPNDVKASAEFWVETLDLSLREQGYSPDGMRDVKTDRGLAGTQLRYTTSRNGRPHRYWLTVFATRSKVHVVEAAGDKVPFDREVAVVDRAIATLDATD